MAIQCLVTQWFGFWRTETHHRFWHSVLCQGWQGFALREQRVSYRAFFPPKKHNCRHFIINSLFLRNELFSFCSNTLSYFLFPLGPVFMVSAQQFQCQCQHKDRSISSLWQIWQSCFQSFWLEAEQVGQPRCFCNESIDWRKKTDILDINGSLESKHLTWEITRKMTPLQDTNWFMVS